MTQVGQTGHFFRKVRQEEARPRPCHHLGKGPTVTRGYAAPNAFANESASQLLISNGFRDSCCLSLLDTNAGSQMPPVAARDTVPSLGDSKPSPTDSWTLKTQHTVGISNFCQRGKAEHR